MGIVKGLTALNKTLEKPSYTSDGVKGRWVKLNDGQSVKIRFLQELDPDSPKYNKNNGVGFIAIEHTNPQDYRRKALCSVDDQGRCYGCEQHRKDPKAGWKGRSRLYINVLVDDGTEDPYVAILSQGSGPKSATPEVIQYAGETGSISDVVWRLKRTGERTDTNYSIIPLPTSEVKDGEEHELYDLEKIAVRDIPYDEQENFYVGTNTASESGYAASSSAEW
jgi:hypothetical protein